MERHLFILLLFTGVVPLILSVPRKYYLIQQGMNWANAQAYCQAEYADLAIINNNDNVDRLQKQQQKWNFISMAWIGLYNDVNSWRWSLDNTPLGNVTLWYTKTPNNAGGNRPCAVVGPWGWYDWQCTDLRGIMCYDECC